MYRIAVFLLITFLASSLLALAQDSNGYLFAAPGGATSGSYTTAMLHIGGGGEGVVGKGIGVGAEIGALGPMECFRCAVGVFSPNGYFHFRRTRGQKIDPFVTGGYTLFFREGHGNLFNFGGGVNYWFSRRVGLRLELRDHVSTSYGSTEHYWGGRIGVAFR